MLFSMPANQQIKHQAIRNMDCQPGDCRWPVYLPKAFAWVCMGSNTHSVNPKGDFWFKKFPKKKLHVCKVQFQ